MDLETQQQVNGFIHSRSMRTKRSEHSTGILESLKSSNESMLETNSQNQKNSSGLMPDGPVFDKMSLNDINTQNETEGTVGESSVGTLAQSVTENPFSLAETSVQSENIRPMSFENSRTLSERESKTYNHSKVDSDTQILTRNNSTLYQYSNGTGESPVVQVQYNTLNNTAENDTVKDTSSENITRNLNSQFLHNDSQTVVQKNGNDLSSERRTTSTLPSQSFENATTFPNPHDRLTLSTDPLPTSNHKPGVLHHALSNSNSNGSTLPSNTSTPTSPFYSTMSTTKSTTLLFYLNANLTEALKSVDWAANNTMYIVPSYSSEYNFKNQTEKLPDAETGHTLLPGKVHTALRIPQNSSLLGLSTISVTKNKAKTPENDPSFHSELSANSTSTSSQLLYLSQANISIEPFPRSLSVTIKPIESGNVPETITEPSNILSVQDSPQVSPVPVPTVDNTISLVTPASKLSSFISPMKVPESVVTYPVPFVSSAESITSSTIVSPVTSSTISSVVNPTEAATSDPIYKTVPLLESGTSSIISSTEPSVATANSSPFSSTVPEPVTSSTISNTVPSSETVTSSTISSVAPSVGTVLTSRISSTVPATLTSNTISNIVPSLETKTSSIISNPVSSVQTVSSSKVSSTVPTVKAVTSSTISKKVQLENTETSSTISNYVPSVKTAISITTSNYSPLVQTETSSTAFSTVQSADNQTSSTISNFGPSVKNIISNISSSAMPSAEPTTSSTISSTVPLAETVTASTISTVSFSTVPSVTYTLTTKDTRQINEFQVSTSGKNHPSHRNEEDRQKSFTSFSDNGNTTSLNITHEVITLACE
jgi:hypothetical protein